MKNTMIVVADSVRARIFTMGDTRTDLSEVDDLTHPEGRLHEREMTSDAPGKANGTNGAGGHAYDNKDSPKKHQLIEFAKQVSSYLDDERKANKLSKLLLFVAPEFLGELRSNFSSELSKMVVYELPKNLASHDLSDIKNYIPKPSEYKVIH